MFVVVYPDEVIIPNNENSIGISHDIFVTLPIEKEKEYYVADCLPDNNDYFSNIDTWGFLPSDPAKPGDEGRIKSALKEWAKDHIHIGKKNLVIDRGIGHCIKDCTNVIVKGNAKVRCIADSAVSGIYNNAKVELACGNTRIFEILDNAEIQRTCDNVVIGFVGNNAKIEFAGGNTEITVLFNNAFIHYLCNDSIVRTAFYPAKIIEASNRAKICIYSRQPNEITFQS